MSHRTATDPPALEDRPWRPSIWLRALAALPPAPWPWGPSIRAAAGVSLPVLIGSAAGHPDAGVWAAMGAMLMALGERPGAYRTRLRAMGIAGPLAASALFLSPLGALPGVVLVAAMTLLGFAAGILSGYANAFSVATMQAMLVAALAIGVDPPTAPWRSAVLLLTGALTATALLGVEASLDRGRPQRDALAELLRALAAAARARADGVGDIATARDRVVRALDTFDRIGLADRVGAEGHTIEYAQVARISAAADQLLARLVAHDAVPERSAETAARLELLARAALPPPNGPAGGLVRLAMLEAAIRGEPGGPDPHRPRWMLRPPGPELVTSAARLALCTGLAYIAFLALPVSRGYWIPMTVALVMKPDLGSVFGRAVLRIAGTAGGVLVAAAVDPLLGEAAATAAVLAVLAACLPWAKSRSYALQTLVMAPLILVLLEVMAPGDSIVGMSLVRLLTTAIAGAIVIVAGYLAWPSARRPQVAPAFERTLRAMAAYARAIADAAPAPVIAARRRAVYRGLSDTHVNLQRTLSEPPPAGRDAWAWLPVVATAERVADRLTDASAAFTPPVPAPRAEVLNAMADDLGRLTDLPRTADPPVRGQAPAVRGGDDADPAVRALAEEIAALAPMIAR